MQRPMLSWNIEIDCIWNVDRSGHLENGRNSAYSYFVLAMAGWTTQSSAMPDRSFIPAGDIEDNRARFRACRKAERSGRRQTVTLLIQAGMQGILFLLDEGF
jgi:hypothetical protein